MLYILFGADDFSLQERLEELKRGWGDPELLAINTTLFEAQQLAPNQLINTCDTAPFLGQFRLVMVKGLLSHLEQSGAYRRPATQSDSAAEWQALVDYVPQMPPTTVLVLIDGKVSKDNPWLKRLAPKANVEEFPLLKGTKLQQWIHSRVAQLGGSISPRAVKLLTELCGENLRILANELEKLHLYARGQVIEEKDVRQITSYAREASVFTMVDAIVEQRAHAAIKLLHQLLAEGVAPSYLLFMVTRQLRLMVQAKTLEAQRLPPGEAQAQLGLSPNYPVDKLLRQTARYPMPRLVEVYSKLLETDLAIKTGKWQDELALDLLIVEVCQKA